MANNRTTVPEQAISFGHNPKYTLGVEIEFQTLDRATWDLTPIAPVLLESAPPLLRPRLSPEFIQSILARILRHGTGADFLRRGYKQTGNLQEVVPSLQREFWQ